jgi:hypothetical protein
MLCKEELFYHPYFSNFAFQFHIWMVQVNQEGLKLNVTHQLLVCADIVNLLSESMHACSKKTHRMFISCYQGEANAEITKCIFVSYEQNARQVTT